MSFFFSLWTRRTEALLPGKQSCFDVVVSRRLGSNSEIKTLMILDSMP